MCASVKQLREAIINFVMCVRLEHLEYHRKGFRDLLFLWIFTKEVEQCEV